MRHLITILMALCLSLPLLADNSVPRPEYPRPQFERSQWVNLNGTWSYTFDFSSTGLERNYPASEGFQGYITVPFCPESKLSGVGYTDFINEMWYQRKVEIPSQWTDKNIIIHFGAVDYAATLYVNGKIAGRHYGGTSSFEIDITRYAKAGECVNLVLRVEDDIRSDLQPGGKQSARFDSYGCMYTRTTGIWQTVWMEAVDRNGLKNVYVKPDLDNSYFVFEPSYYSLENGLKLKIDVKDSGKTVASRTVVASQNQTVVIPVKKVKTWSPESPFLYDIEYQVLDKEGKVIDKVSSYSGMRKIHVEGNRMYLNNKAIFLRFVLDQGFNPDGIWTAPSDEALRHDIEMSMNVGFNGARLHQKVFEERFHYWADKLGYLTWGECSSWGFDVNNEEGARNFISEWEEIVVRDRNHPSIIAWTPFNESWGRKRDVEAARTHDRILTDVYRITHNLDYRPVNDSSGGYHVLTDLWTYHDYKQNAQDLKERLTLKEDGKVPTFDQARECAYTGQPYFLDEYGGIKWVIEQYSEISWGYGNGPKTVEELYERLEALTDTILGFDYISGYCYTQLTDVEQEQNGIYTYDRREKFDSEVLKSIFGKVPQWAK